jgi:hypothetical protein
MRQSKPDPGRCEVLLMGGPHAGDGGSGGDPGTEPAREKHSCDRADAQGTEWIPAAVLFRELRALGYSGGLTTLKMGLRVDRDTENARVGTWLREVANARVHATTGEVPAVRLAEERERLQPLPPPWTGRIARARVKPPAPPPRGYQHPLRVYEDLLAAQE